MDKEHLKFTKTHEWIEPQGSRRKVGISDFAQSQMGDIVYVEFPETDRDVEAGEEVCVIESCKATASIYAPVKGRIASHNGALHDAPEKINQSPYGEGWLFEIQVEAEVNDSALMNHSDYLTTCKEE